jgi:hypothetical protein
MRKQRKRGQQASAKTVRDRRAGRSDDTNPPPSANGLPGGREMPCYDRERHELRIGDTVVKRFTQESDAQEVIVQAFQEENWCRVIDDPLTGKAGQDAKQRVRTAVANLNRRQRVPLLRFGVLRQGRGVSWEFRADSDSRATVERQ